MKKIVITFIILLSFLGSSWGQKNGKLLWEKKLNSINKLDYLSTASSYKKGDFSTLIWNKAGNTGAVDKDGNFIWQSSTIQIVGNNNFLALKNDTLYRIDKALNFINSPSILFPSNLRDGFIREVTDGYIVMDANTNNIIKWDFEGKEIWRYKVNNDINLNYNLLSETLSGYRLDYSVLGKGKEQSRLFYLNLDKQGKLTGLIDKKITPSYRLGTIPILTADRGVWLHESPAGSIGSSIMVRLDSTNKEIARFYLYEVPKLVGRIDAVPALSSSNFSDLPLGVTPSGALIYGFYTVDNDKKPKSLFFAKIDGVSKPILTDEINLKERSIETRSFSSTLPTYVKVIDEDRFIFSTSTGFNYNSTQDADEGIGGVNFKSKNSIWLQKIDNKVGIDQTYSTYGTTITDKENSIPIIRNDSLICYSIDGKVKWSKANVNKWDYLSMGENPSYILNIFGRIPISYIFAINDSLTTKIRVSDGKELWTLKLKPAKLVYEDSEGNSFLYREEMIGYTGRKYSLDFISKTGKIASIYQSPNIDFNQAGFSPGISQFNDYQNRLRYEIDDKNKFFYAHALEKQSDETFQFIYRKYSLACLYDLEAIAQATGKTEVCAGIKVKLSTTKQEGLTYQWQKDGKDIPTFRDVVHDVEESGNYTVTVKDEACQNQAMSNPIPVTIKPTPEATITTDVKTVIYEPFTVKMTANTGTGLSYQWLKDDVVIPKYYYTILN
jgi:hypothetical protein